MPTLYGPVAAVDDFPWIVDPNVWNPSGLVYPTDYTQEVTYTPSSPNIGFTVNWSFNPTNATSAGSYSQPNLIYEPVQYSTNYSLVSSNVDLPIMLGNVSSLYVNWSASWTNNNAAYPTAAGIDVNIDMQILNNDGTTAADIPIFIQNWLNGGTPLGSVIGSFVIDGYTWDLWYDPTVPWGTQGNIKGLTFTTSDPIPSGHLNLEDFFAILKSKGYVSDDQYLNNVRIGPEIISGTGTFTANYFNIDVNGQGQYLQSNQVDYYGSIANDSIYIYGSRFGPNPGANTVVSQPDTFSVPVDVSFAGNIVNGQTATLEFFLNGSEVGTYHLTPTPGGYVDASGISWTTNQHFQITLPGVSSVSGLTVVFDSPGNLGGAEQSAVYFSSVTIGGMALTGCTVTGPDGSTYTESLPAADGTGGNAGLSAGLSISFDASAWDQAVSQRTIGTGANPIIVNGDGGVDSLYVLGDPSAFTIASEGLNQYLLSENSGLDQNAILKGIAFVDFQNGVVLALGAVDRENFNGDGMSDILWRDANGSVELYDSNGGSGFTGFAGQGLGTVDNGWAIQQTGDFNWDGKADILWRNANGDVYLDLSNAGTGFAGVTGQDLGVIPTSWTIEQVGDFNGDGKADILWRNTNGDVELYLSKAGGGFTGFTGQDIGVIPTSWSIQQVGDFNGDGKADILWRNSGSGDVEVYLSNAGAGFTGFAGVDIGALGASWTLQQVGDFNGVGKDGMLWRNSNGDVELYLANPGAGLTGFTVVDVGVISSDWSIQTVGDYNGDGKADILWRNTNGDVVFWLSNTGSGYTGFTSHDNGVVGTDWKIVGDSPPPLGSVPGHQTVTSAAQAAPPPSLSNAGASVSHHAGGAAAWHAVTVNIDDGGHLSNGLETSLTVTDPFQANLHAHPDHLLFG